MDGLLPGFESRRLTTSGAEIRLRVGGSGPPLLLLHGYPQTHVMWHKVAPALAERFTVVLPDLRGYGESSKPEPGAGHAAYAKRALAADQVEVMAQLGFARFQVGAHDRGARVAHRLALDHPERIERLALLDIVPTRYRFQTLTASTARKSYHWFFLIQPGGLPERLIGNDPDFFLTHSLHSWAGSPDAFAPAAMAEYLRCFRDPATIRGTCDEYRAAATIDLEHDAADADRRIACPLLVLWGTGSAQGGSYDLLDIWRRHAAGPVAGQGIPCGHFLPEEAPEEVTAALGTFFTGEDPA